EANGYGVLTSGSACMAVIGFLDGYKQAKQRFSSDQTLRFAVNNVMEEVLMTTAGLSGVHVSYSAEESGFLFTYRPDLKTNIYDEAAACLKAIQHTLHQVLKLQMSFMIGESSTTPEQLKAGLKALLASETQRFYMQEGSTVKMRAASVAQQ